MNKIKNLERDYFGINERDLFEREYDILFEGKKNIPFNAVLVDKMGNCFMCGKCEGISKHFVFGNERRVWLKDGSVIFVTATEIERLNEYDLMKVPKENFVFKVEESTYTPRKDMLLFNPYEKQSSGICFKFDYDKSSLVEIIFIPDNFYKYFSNNTNLETKQQIYNEIYKVYTNIENNFDRTLLSMMLKKLENSNKYYAIIERIGLEEEYDFVKYLYENKNINYIEQEKKLYDLSFVESMYGLDDLDKIKKDYMKTDYKNIIDQLKEFKKKLLFPGICSKPKDIVQPLKINDFYTKQYIENIKLKLSKIDNISNYNEFLDILDLFSMKMIKTEDFDFCMKKVLQKSAFIDNSTHLMWTDLLEMKSYISLMHAIYSCERYNVKIFNNEKTMKQLKFLLKDNQLSLKDLYNFQVIDYEKKQDKKEKFFARSIISKYETLNKTKEFKLDLYKDIIKYFIEEFIKIENSSISFTFEDQLLNTIFEYIKNNHIDFLEEIIRQETFGYLERKEYFKKIKVEKDLFSIINQYLNKDN